ncbi:carotenoid 9,10-9',10' cleavage dioxygenase [Sorangium cellulosum]|uniref:Carotenoid 9,10-9',10' cleavage dioxygenase n=1 Tax=Sorangium cellulosum TaxID=56 RepID=A0A2L0F6V3_SORCE|nr:carotenoid oxygenase family protein [Sorangium cellulosum]AUX47324.1 carotenoid 9,10-9',10' cleavage dioxygenase [Sorangium cellulosum]
MTTTTSAASPEPLPFHLTGNFAPVLDELTVHDLEVTGTLPPELTGTYVRNGPNPRNGPSPIWFLGQGMLHGVRLERGRARWYRNRWIDAPTTSNTNIVRHAGKMLALVETAPPVAVSDELETLGAFDFAGGLTRGMTAHPKICPSTGELLFFTYSLQPPFVTYYRADTSGALVQSEPIQVGSPTYMHDFAITKRYALLLDLPVLFNGWRTPMPIQWSDDYGARIGVLPRDGRGDQVRWFPIAPCSIVHTANAYEEGGTIVLDVVRAPRLDGPSQLFRYTLDLERGVAHEAPLDARHVEFPRIDERRTGSAHRYVYALELCDIVNGIPTDCVLRKYDVTTGRCTVHDFGPGRVSGECIFVPRTPGSGEDDGYALCYVHDRDRNTSDLVVLDAADFAAPALATVALPRRVPYGIHGNWFPELG